MTRALSAVAVGLAIAAISPEGLAVQVDPAQQTTTLVIHHFGRPIGQEQSLLSRNGTDVALTSKLDFTDRGARVELSSSLQLGPDLTPVHFQAKGKTYRFVNIDAEVDVRDGIAQTRSLGKTSSTQVPSRFFAARGYSPLAARALLVQYWERHGRPHEITLLPDGNSVKVEFRGVDSVQVSGRSIRLRRYAVDGVVWGKEAVWLDDQNRLAALLTRIHILPLEAVRDDLLPALPALQLRAVQDRMADLSALAGQVRPLAQDSFALVGARLLDGTGRAPIDNAVVIVRDGHISAAGPRSTVPIPSGVRVISADGKTIIPGLWDMHGHLSQIEWGPAYLAAGVTSARDMGGERPFLTEFRDALAGARGVGPTLVLAGLVEGGGPDGYGTTIASTPEEARAIVDAYQAAGFAQMKLYNRAAADVVVATARRAHELGMTVTGHIPTSLSLQQAIEAGMDGFEHLPIRGEPDSVEVRDTAQFLARRGTVADPTLAWDELLNRAPATLVSSFEPGILQAPTPLASSYSSVTNNIDSTTAQANRRRGLGVVKALHDAGVVLVAGTDGALPGHSLLRTLELFVEAGMTPAEALASATTVPAKVMRMERNVGTIEAGKKADLLVLDADPLAEIANIRKGRWVVANGRLYECAALWRSVGFTPRQ